MAKKKIKGTQEDPLTREEAISAGIDVEAVEANAVTVEEALKEPTYPRVIKSWVYNGFPMERVEVAPGVTEDRLIK